MNQSEVNYCVRCGTSLRLETRIGTLRKVCPDCDWIFFHDPKVAVAVLIKHEDKILLARRLNEPSKGKWTFPAGFIDAGEDPRDAAARECLEETGLQVTITELVDVLYGQEHKHGAHIIIFFKGVVLSGIPIAGDDVDQVSFFPINNLPELAFSTTKKVIDLLTIPN